MLPNEIAAVQVWGTDGWVIAHTLMSIRINLKGRHVAARSSPFAIRFSGLVCRSFYRNYSCVTFFATNSFPLPTDYFLVGPVI